MNDAIVDKRGQRGGSQVNRQRFFERAKPLLKEAVKKIFRKGSFTDSHKDGVDVTIPKKSINEPFFRHGAGGRRENVHPGNDRFIPGDTVPRPRGSGSGGGGKEASSDGEGEDNFRFLLTGKEFLELLFEDLALPNFIKAALLADMEEYRWRRAGITTAGPPGNLHITRSYRQSFGRRLVFGKKKKQEYLAQLEEEFAALIQKDVWDANDEQRMADLVEEIAEMKRKLLGIPFFDTSDLRFKQFAKEPEPTARAVMFCLMDVSGSMTESRKTTAKYFFLLLFLFLKRHYPKVEVVFIKHHTIAQEVDEKTFFESQETGGTVVSTALALMRDIIRERYSDPSWNIYGAQASDGENWSLDSNICEALLEDDILPLTRYFAYVQIEEVKKSELWYRYLHIYEHSKWKDRFAMEYIENEAGIYPVFEKLFKKKENA